MAKKAEKTSVKISIPDIPKNDKGQMVGAHGETREYFIFYTAFREALEYLKPSDKAELLDAIICYAFDGKEPENLAGKAWAMGWAFIHRTISTGISKWYGGTLGAEFGENGGAPKGNQNARKNNDEKQPQNNPYSTPKQPQNNPYLNGGVDLGLYKKEKEKESKSKSKNKKLSDESKKVPTGGTPSSSKNRVFEIPSLEDVKAYGTSIGVTEAQAEIYHDSKTANGWTLGNGKSVKDWQADLRVWKRKGYLDSKQPTSTRTNAPATGATITPKWAE